MCDINRPIIDTNRLMETRSERLSISTVRAKRRNMRDLQEQLASATMCHAATLPPNLPIVSASAVSRKAVMSEKGAGNSHIKKMLRMMLPAGIHGISGTLNPLGLYACVGPGTRLIPRADALPLSAKSNV